MMARIKHNQSRNPGFALVITLIMVVLAAIIVIAFLSSASLDRTTAGSYNDRYQAEIAVQNGLEAAKKSLSTDGVGNAISSDDLFLVTRVAQGAASSPGAEDTTAHYYYIGQTKAGTGNITYYPLFSGGTPQTVSTTVQPTFVPFPASTPSTATNFPVLLPDPATPANYLLPAVTTQWIDVVDPVATSPEAPKLRYSFWIEDLGGYIDADTAGNKSGPGASHTRDTTIMQPLIKAGTVTPTSLVAMWTLFNSTATDSTQSPQQSDNQSIVSNRPILFTSDTVKESIVSSTAPSYLSKVSRHIIARTRPDSEQAVIPFAVLARPSPSPASYYTTSATPKVDINAKITAKDVDGIATAIKTYLPDWAAVRRGAFGSTLSGTTAMDDSYRRTIAANIIGYAQPVVDPPIVGTDYRGIGLFPFVVEYCDEFVWSSKGFYKGPSDTYIADVTITPFIQVWNMFDKRIDSGTLRFVDNNKTGVSVGTCPQKTCSGATRSAFVLTSFDKLDAAAKRTPMEGSIDFSKTPLATNSYNVFALPSRLYNVDTGSSVPPDTTSPNPTPAVYIGLKTNTNSDDTLSSYQVYWNGQLVDQPGIVSGPTKPQQMVRPNSTLSRNGAPDFHTTLPGLRYSAAGNTGPYNLGDPRGSYYVNTPQEANTYDDSSWGGRIRMWTYYATTWPAGEARTAGWPDGGHNTANPGPSPKNASELPPVVAARATTAASDAMLAPARISNDGRLSSITELGFIYDPFQWDPFGTTKPLKATDVDQVWRDAWKNGFKAVSGTYTSHSTLRLGRPEFLTFDRDGARASQLLDIFCAAPRRETQGLINLNTATRETLRALGAGLLLNRDLAMKDSSGSPINTLYPPYTADQADKFADAVINARNTKPFISTSQLAQLLDSTGAPFFGNTAQWTPPQTAPAEWSDAAAEEYFARIFDLTSVRSRNFRVFVTGQYVDPRFLDASGNPKVLSTVKKVYQVFLQPTRDPVTGAITSQACQVTYAANLP